MFHAFTGGAQFEAYHKPEHLIDLDNGIICKNKDSTEVVKSITADGGYFNAEQAVGLRSVECEVSMRDPHAEKRSYKQYTRANAEHLKNELEKIRQTMNREWSIKYRKRRSELVERSFAYILDNGGT